LFCCHASETEKRFCEKARATQLLNRGQFDNRGRAQREKGHAFGEKKKAQGEAEDSNMSVGAIRGGKV